MEISNEGIEWFKNKKIEMDRMPIISGSILFVLFAIILSFMDKDVSYVGFYLVGFLIGILCGGKIMILMVYQELQRRS